VTSRFVGSGAEGILREGETALLFSVGDAAGAAIAIESLARDPDRLARLSAAARAAVDGRYTWRACVDGWAAALDEVTEVPLRTVQATAWMALPPTGRLDRLPVPVGLRDFRRQTRVRVFGVPRAQLGGEEWPFVDSRHAEAALQEIDVTSRRLDMRGA
jgi:hypothetical protein